MSSSSENFTYIDLFAGIGGFRKAIDESGGKCLFSSEIDEFATKAYSTLYGSDNLYGDIKQIEAKDIPDHDLLVGGFPCTAFSIAGRKLGFKDTKGTLFFEIARILAEKKPKAVLLENVKNLVSHDKGRTMKVIMYTLNELGYTIDYTVLNSKYYDVPQNRERVYIVAVRNDLVNHEDWNVVGSNVVAKGKRELLTDKDMRTFNFAYPISNVVTKRLKAILEDDVDPKFVFPYEKVKRLLTELDERGLKDIETVAVEGNLKPPEATRIGTRDDVWGENGVAGTLNATDYKQPRPIVEEISPIMVGHIDLNGHDILKRVYSEDGVSSTVDTMSGGNRHPKVVERKQSYSHKYRIRKLTPRECWRLQAFSDEDFDKVQNAGISNTQLYKQAGNAVTVNVIRAIMPNLLTYIHKQS